MRARQPILAATAFVLGSFAACGGGGGGGGDEDPPLGPNAAPQMTVPGSLSGSAPNFAAIVPAAATQSLTFRATDPDGDPLSWQVSVAGAGATATGVSFPPAASGDSFTLELAAVTLPAASQLTVLVEDPRGGASAVDVQLVRSGAPVVDSVAPGSAFTSVPQRVTLRGHGFRLGGVVTANVTFQGVNAIDVVVVGDEELQCTTPLLAPGPAVVAVTHVFGTGGLAPGAFTAHAFPPVFAANDQRLGLPAALVAFDLALAGRTLHAVAAHAGPPTPALAHQGSVDGGATWSQPLWLDGTEAPVQPQVVLAGDDVAVTWAGVVVPPAPSLVAFTRSLDGGQTFPTLLQLDDPLPPATQVQRPRIARDGERLVAAWIEGDPLLGTARVTTTTSANAGAGFDTAQQADDGQANQADHELGLAGQDAWLVFTDERLGAAARGVYALHSADGGATWGIARRLSPGTTFASAPRASAAGGRVHAAWLQDGALRTTSSADDGRNWSASSLIVDDGTGGVIASHAVAARGEQACFVYTVGGSSVWVARIVQAGAPVQRVQVDATASPSAETSIHVDGNYVYVAWREGDPTAGTARVQLAVSGDGGATFPWTGGLGDGTAAQREPRLVHDGSRLFLGWSDDRDGAPALYTNRTVQ